MKEGKKEIATISSAESGAGRRKEVEWRHKNSLRPSRSVGVWGFGLGWKEKSGTKRGKATREVGETGRSPKPVFYTCVGGLPLSPPISILGTGKSVFSVLDRCGVLRQKSWKWP